MITTDLAFKQWGTTSPAASVVALVDRFAQDCRRVEIIGESWRVKHRLDAGRPKPAPSRSRRKVDRVPDSRALAAESRFGDRAVSICSFRPATRGIATQKRRRGYEFMVTFPASAVHAPPPA